MSVDPMGLDILGIEITRLDGRSTPYSAIPGSQTALPRLAHGVYLVKLKTGNGVFQEKIAIPQ